MQPKWVPEKWQKRYRERPRLDVPPPRCSICYEPTGIIVSTDCDHVYCLDCLEKWQKKEKKTTCPMCRKELEWYTRHPDVYGADLYSDEEEEDQGVQQPEPELEPPSEEPTGLLIYGGLYLGFILNEASFNARLQEFKDDDMLLFRSYGLNTMTYIDLDALVPFIVAVVTYVRPPASRDYSLDDVCRKEWEAVVLQMEEVLENYRGEQLEPLDLRELFECSFKSYLAQKGSAYPPRYAEKAVLAATKGSFEGCLELVYNVVTRRAQDVWRARFARA